ncbi:MAG: hypothetical protein FJZ15_04310 [Candidatus Omnitrophica bacterium]|nr:hypothetical protein [Candidatus Omnitrophota bacterium]
MKKLLIMFIFCLACHFVFAEDVKNEIEIQFTDEDSVVEITPADPGAEAPKSLAASQNVTLDFKDADINNVLKIISFKSGTNIVATPDVIGNVSIRLVDVPWEKALDVILKTYGYAYEKQANIILVTKAENISKIQAEEPLRTEVYNLKFLDAQDAEKGIVPLLSNRGRVAVLYSKGQKGWQFGTFKIGKSGTSSEGPTRIEQGQGSQLETIALEKNAAGAVIPVKVDLPSSIKSKTLVITDTAASLDRIKSFLDEIDKKPKQVLIEAKFMEVNTDKLRDIGFDWGTGSSGASGYATPPYDIGLNKNNLTTLAGRNLASEFTPGKFSPLEGTTVFPGTYPYKAGLELLFKKLGGSQFEVIIHALEEDAHANTLSAPRIVTLDNQEASMLVGYHTPILSATVTAGTDTTGPTQTQTLDYYQEIGIRLNVVPQVSDEGYINMLIHPSITSSNSNVTATSSAGTGQQAVTTEINYPIITVREAQTQIMMKDGETVVLGGLLSDVKSKQTIGVPFFSKIPILGGFFRRDIYDTGKVDLLIFITAHIVNEKTQLTLEEIAELQKKYFTSPLDEKEAKKKKKAKK